MTERVMNTCAVKGIENSSLVNIFSINFFPDMPCHKLAGQGLYLLLGDRLMKITLSQTENN